MDKKGSMQNRGNNNLRKIVHDWMHYLHFCWYFMHLLKLTRHYQDYCRSLELLVWSSMNRYRACRICNSCCLWQTYSSIQIFISYWNCQMNLSFRFFKDGIFEKIFLFDGMMANFMYRYKNSKHYDKRKL